MYCRNCKTTIDTKYIIYRGFDMNFCSKNCRLHIEEAIIKIDPSITKFTEWASVSGVTPLSNETCYYNDHKRNSPLPKTISIFKSLDIIEYPSIIDIDYYDSSSENSFDLKYVNKHHYDSCSENSFDLKYVNKHHYDTVLDKIYNIFNYTTSYSLKLIDIINNSVMFFYKS